MDCGGGRQGAAMGLGCAKPTHNEIQTDVQHDGGKRDKKPVNKEKDPEKKKVAKEKKHKNSVGSSQSMNSNRPGKKAKQKKKKKSKHSKGKSDQSKAKHKNKKKSPKGDPTWDKEALYPALQVPLRTKRAKAYTLIEEKNQVWDKGKIFKGRNLMTNEEVEIWAQVRESPRGCLDFPLKLEILASNRLNSARHLCRKMDGNKHKEHCIYAMVSPVGRTIEELRKRRPQGFTFSTAMRIGLQCFHRIRQAHDVDMLVRLVDPSNFALFRPLSTTNDRPQVEFVIVTFANAAVLPNGHFTNGTKALAVSLFSQGRTENLPDYAKNNYLYAPMDEMKMHENKEFGYGKKHDLESWFYLLVDLLGGALPWRKRTDRANIADMKLESIKSEGICDELPTQLLGIIRWIQDCPKTSRPDYHRILDLLRDIVKEKNIYPMEPYDWE